MTTPNAVLRAALAELVDEGVLTTEQADRIAVRLQPLQPSPPGPGRRYRSMSLGTEIAGYLGGALVLGGGAMVVAPAWGSIPMPVRFGLAVFVTIMLAGGALAVRRALADHAGQDGLPRLASTLGALSAGAAAVTVTIPVASGWRPLAGSLAAFVVAAAGYRLVRRAPLLVAAWIASTVLVGALLDRADVHANAVWVSAYAALGAGWLLLGGQRWRRLVTEPGVASLLGGATGLSAAEAATADGRGMAAYGMVLGAAFATACYGRYLGSRHWSALLPAVLIALVIPATGLAVVFHSVLGAGLTVAVIGVVLLVAGGVALTNWRPEPPAGQA